MTLQRLEIEHFRCVESAKLEFSTSRNLITGLNGGGKTTVLESIFLLGSGRSFRSTDLETLVQASRKSFLIVGELDGGELGTKTIGAKCGSGEREFRINRQPPKNLGDLVRHFPVQVIDPSVHKLVEEGPKRRRQFIDWGVFHVEQSFQQAWSHFNRALKQRNAALSTNRSKAEVGVWDKDIAVQGTLIDQHRQQYLEQLRPFIVDVGQRLLGDEVDIEYFSGWKRNLSLHEALIDSKNADFRRGATGVGPHRADLLLKVRGHLAKERISRGQQKMLACALILAQQQHRTSLSQPSASLLLDDPAAELDASNLCKLVSVVSELPIQLFITSLSSAGLEIFKDAKRFHVERGNIQVMA